MITASGTKTQRRLRARFERFAFEAVASESLDLSTLQPLKINIKTVLNGYLCLPTPEFILNICHAPNSPKGRG